MKIKFKNFYLILLLACFFFFFYGFSLQAADSIKIGVAGPLSGDLAPYGIPPKNILLLEAERINQAGGILGKKIEILAEDDVCKPGVATNVASKLVGEKVVAVIGHICSGATIAAMSVYREAGIPVLSPSATNPAISLSGDNPNFFRTIPHDLAQAELQVKFITQKLNANSVAVIHDKGDYGKGLANLVKEGLLKKGVTVVLFEGVTPGAVDYSALIRKIKRARPDVVAFGGYHPEGSKIVTQARKRKIKADFISGDGLKDPSFIKIGRKYVEGYYVTSPADISQIKITKEITKELKSRNQKPGNFGLQAHAAFTAVIKAIQKTNSTKPEELVQALKTLKFKTTLGEISFDSHGDVIGSGFSVYRVQKGAFVPVKW